MKDFDESKPFSIKGYKTYFPLQRPGTSFKRLLCFVSERIEVKQGSDLVSNLISTVWLEVKGAKQKVLICAIYRKFSDLIVKGQMTIDQQIERWKIFHSQVEQAKKEGLNFLYGRYEYQPEKIGRLNLLLEKIS